VPEVEPYVSDWTIDIEVVTVFTECRRKRGKPPKIEYESQVKAIAVYLCVIVLIAVKRLAQFFHEVSHGLIPVSKATLAVFTSDASDNIDLTDNVHNLLNGQVINTDETPIKTGCLKPLKKPRLTHIFAPIPTKQPPF
jgi:hypothetical protein